MKRLIPISIALGAAVVGGKKLYEKSPAVQAVVDTTITIFNDTIDTIQEAADSYVKQKAVRDMEKRACDCGECEVCQMFEREDL